MLPGLAPIETGEDCDAAGDSWFTPPWLLAWLPPIALDPCWSAASHVKAAATIDIRRGEDGLTMPWGPVGDGIVFANPPFSNCAAWLQRCRQEAKRLDRVVVALVPAIPGDGPWHAEVWPFARAVGFIRGRVAFVDPQGNSETKGRGHALVLYGPSFDCIEAREHIEVASERHPQAPVWVEVVR